MTKIGNIGRRWVKHIARRSGVLRMGLFKRLVRTGRKYLSMEQPFGLAVGAAQANDWEGTRDALGEYLNRHRARHDFPASTLPAVSDADVRIKLAQMWVSIEGRNRASVDYLMSALTAMPEFVAPPPAHQDLEGFMAANGHRLTEYEATYGRERADLSFWSDWIDPSDALRFRSEVFVSQAAAHAPCVFGRAALRDAYYLALLYARSVDQLGALDLFDDDGVFGGLRFKIGDRIVSRAILDSVIELNFLALHCGLQRDSPFTLIDIGAGSGRLVSRALRLFPNVTAYAFDVVPFSSFICEHYLTFRGLRDRVTIGPPATLAVVEGASPRIATNIHSWDEAPMRSIVKWLAGLRDAKADWLFLVTNSAEPVSVELDTSGGVVQSQPIIPAIKASGF